MPPAASPASVAAWSAGALDRALASDAELLVARFASEAVLLGAFQRRSEIATTLEVFRRGSGGGAARVGEGALYVGLALRRHDALIACEPARMVNRYVRPLLKALTKCGARGEYTGRDWVSVHHRPVGSVGFAHDATTGRAMFEAIVGVTTPFALADRASFHGKAPATIVEAIGHDVDLQRIVTAITDAYATTTTTTTTETSPAITADAPWTATAIVPIGWVGAGRDANGELRVGGELMASRDAMANLEAGLARLPRDAVDADVASVVDATLAAPGVVVEGVTSLASILDVILRAR